MVNWNSPSSNLTSKCRQAFKQMNNDPLKQRISHYQQRIEKALDQWLPSPLTHPTRLHEAMRYAVLNGGKRIRPILTYATGEALNIPLENLDGIASAVEIIHSYSLVHDDLPAMDDDDLRRGVATCHTAFDEATAILAGDALQALSFYVITHDQKLAVDHSVRLQIIEKLALACGSRGMAGGQAIDLSSVGQTLNVMQLEDMHIHKTGALIRASISLAALAAPNPDANELVSLDHFGKCIGLAFQIHDDILDEISDTETLGKTHGTDRAKNKPTYPSIVGLQVSKQRTQDLYQEAIESLQSLGSRNTEYLHYIAELIVKRNH